MPSSIGRRLTFYATPSTGNQPGTAKIIFQSESGMARSFLIVLGQRHTKLLLESLRHLGDPIRFGDERAADSGNVMRFSPIPPQRSVRRLKCGEKNW
ncbi:hypothetical protein [Paenibacillus oleatilyticus]|uniref:hypothetical protein n=1 Tax=Paenibacillus oleatilyticus TaxID=2594886 RepID=UPI0027B8AA67|nr:hypothetical protein [Paenibacillus oleatilyticus]